LSHSCDWCAGDSQWAAVDADHHASPLMAQINTNHQSPRPLLPLLF